MPGILPIAIAPSMRRDYAIIIRNPAIRLATLGLICQGIAYASTTPYQSVIGIGHFGMSDSHYSIFLFLVALISVAASILLGALSDSLTDRKRLIIALACCGLAGYGSIYAFDSALVFIVSMLTFIPLTRSQFSLLFANVRRETKAEPTEVSAAVNSNIRAIFALSWIAVPGLVAWWVSSGGDKAVARVYLVAALAALLIALAYWLFAPASKDEPASSTPSTASL